MKNLAFAFLLSSLALASAHRVYAADAKNDPSLYTLTVHVSASEYAPPDDVTNEILTVTIDAKHYRLRGGTTSAKNKFALINPGDYQARLTQDEHKTGYESRQKYEFLFPDGTTRSFQVIGQSE